MPSRPITSAAPHNAIPMWTDGRALFAELPGPHGHPTILRYPLSIAGLSDALALVRSAAFDTLDRTAIAINGQPRAGSFAQQLDAQAELKRLGILRS